MLVQASQSKKEAKRAKNKGDTKIRKNDPKNGSKMTGSSTRQL
jgi:hypothetical protein